MGHALAVLRDGALWLSYRPLAALKEPQTHVVDVVARVVAIGSRVDEMRAMAELRRPVSLPVNVPWMVVYGFVVPPLPRLPFGDDDDDDLDAYASDDDDDDDDDADESAWDHHTVYVWGDLSFASTARDGHIPITHNQMNQIVPQVMCGRVLSSSDPRRNYECSWTTSKSWIAQAQHYWETAKGESRALCGPTFPVKPGERVESRIAYDPLSGVVRIGIASLDNPAKRSVIDSTNPFMDIPYPGGWPSFLSAMAQGNARGAAGRSCFNIEYKATACSLRVMRSMCPLHVFRASFPSPTSATSINTFLRTSEWDIGTLGFLAADDDEDDDGAIANATVVVFDSPHDST